MFEIPTGISLLANIVIADPALCDNVILFPPANCNVPDDTRAIVPVVFPASVRSNRFCVCVDWLLALIVIVDKFCDRLIFAPATRLIAPVDPFIATVL